MSVYDYSSPLAAGHIRLLTLLPGQYEHNINCTLSVESLGNAPNYETLSYVWGNPKITVDIVINGRGFAATTNLESALRHVRYANTARVLWVDALCINQMNGAEKIAQIGLMADIYQQSSRVLAWLGNLNSQETSQTDVQAFFDFMTRVALKTDGTETDTDMNVEPHLPVIKAMMKSPWWTRIWTVQEIILPPAGLVHWGFCSCPWEILDAAREVLYQRTHQTKKASLLDKSGPFFQFKSSVRSVTRAREGHSFYEILWRFRDRNATEPQDKIFGLLGLIPPLQRHLFHIYDRGYETDIVKVCFRMAVDLINAQGNLECLIGLGAGPQPNPKMPSWVWDWSTYPHGHNTTICHSFWNHLATDTWYSASKGKSLVVKTDESDFSLQLTGIKIANIGWNYKMPSPYHESGATQRNTTQILDLDVDRHVNAQLIRSVLQSLEMQVDMKKSYILNAKNSYEDIFWRTLLGGLITKENGSPPNRKANEIDDAELRKITENGACEAVREDGYFGDCVCQSVIAYAGMHKVFLASPEYLGLGPRFMREGDEVWILFGGNTPYVLRPINRDDGVHQKKFMFIGECYVHGIMEGEAMENPDLQAVSETVFLY